MPNVSFVCFSFEDASPLARKHDSVITYKTIDTGSRTEANIQTLAKQPHIHARQRFIFREDSLT